MNISSWKILSAIFLLLSVLYCGGCQDEFIRKEKDYAKEIAKNQNLAVFTLLNFHIAQGEFQKSCVQDENGDGFGEFGTLSQLKHAGVLPEGYDKAIDDRNDFMTWNGYVFRVYMPREKSRRQYSWYAAAWPLTLGKSGMAVLMIDSDGRVFMNPNDGTGSVLNVEGLGKGPDSALIYDDPKWLTRFRSQYWAELRPGVEEKPEGR